MNKDKQIADLKAEIDLLNKQLEAAMCDYEKEANRNYIYKELADFQAFVEKQKRTAGKAGDIRFVDFCLSVEEMIRRYVKEKNQSPEDVCTWTYDWDLDCYNTSCGKSWTLNDGTPAENDMKYCLYCGGKLEEKIDEAQE